MKPNAELKKQLRSQFKNLLAAQAAALLLCLAAANGEAQSYNTLYSFTWSGGGEPSAVLILSGTTLYGATESGGSSQGGTVFKVNTDGSGYTALKNFTWGDSGGAAPWPSGSLVLSDNTLYGVAGAGGPSNDGLVFKVNTDASDFTVLKSFNGSDGSHPHQGLVLSGTVLYGTTEGGGSNRSGTVFKINTDGTGYSVLKEFTCSLDGCAPQTGLILSGTTLYGTALEGGEFGCGTLFRIDVDGSNYAVLKHFQGGADGGFPYTGLMLSGTALYGTTYGGGTTPHWFGSVFKINTDGSDYTVLKQFVGQDGANPMSILVLNGKTLYGTTYAGGIGFDGSWQSGNGLVFQIDTNGCNFSVLKYFNGNSDGAHPEAGLVLSGSTLYGTTFDGGDNQIGVVFSLSAPAPIIINPLLSQTAETGDTVGLTVDCTGEPPLTFQWFFNDTNAVSDPTTNSDLVLTNVQFTNSGNYTVVVSNPFNVVTSTPALLNVITPVERRPVPAINLGAPSGSLLGLDYCDAFGSTADWETMATMTMSNSSQFYFDISEPLPPQRFYRAWQSGTPDLVPSLGLPGFVPAITLTGNPGDSLELDYINQFGPTDAWVTLDTVTLTNASQLYFDVSALGQPPRLWRIVPVP